MPIQTAQGGVMNNPLPGGGAAVHAGAVAVINQLTYGHLWGAAGGLIPGHVHLDLQGYTGLGWMNLQVQVGGGHSTVATALVAPTVQSVATPGPRRNAQQIEIVRKIKSALFDSLNDYEHANPHNWDVTGTPSS